LKKLKDYFTVSSTMDINMVRRLRLVDAISDVLNQICERNDRFISSINITPLTRFHALQAPLITIKAYLARIAWGWSCSEVCLVLALIYIDRLIEMDRCFTVNSLSIHRVMITSIMLAVKFLNDKVFPDKYYVREMFVSKKELNMLLMDFLFRINFHLDIETSLYRAYNERLIIHSFNGVNLEGYQEGWLWEETQAPRPSSEAQALFQEQEVKEHQADQQPYNPIQQVEVQPNLAIEQSVSQLSPVSPSYNQNHNESGFAPSPNFIMEDPPDV